MSAFVCAISAMSVALLYNTWRSYQVQQKQQLRERVAYMLWIMANNVPDRERS